MVEYDKYCFKSKEQPKQVKKKENTYYIVCEKKTDNKNIKGIALEEKIGQQKSTCVDCNSRKTTFLKAVKPKKTKNSFYILQSMQIYCKNCKKHTGKTFPKKLVPISKNTIKYKKNQNVLFV